MTIGVEDTDYVNLVKLLRVAESAALAIDGIAGVIADGNVRLEHPDMLANVAAELREAARVVRKGPVPF